jgi:hypothetical protein
MIPWLAFSWNAFPKRFALACIFLVALLPRPARAEQPDAFSIEWNAPADCPSADAVRSAIRRYLSAGQSSSDVHVNATASVARASGGWRVGITTEIEGAKSRKAFVDASCESVADAFALMVALTVNPEKVAAYRAKVEAIPPPVSAPQPERARPAAPPPTPLPERSTFATAAVLGAADFGTIPETSLGAGIAAGYVLRWLHVEAVAIVEPFHSVQMGNLAGVGARFRTLRVGMRGCLAWSIAWFEMGPCAGEEIIWMVGRGFGPTDTFDTFEEGRTWAELVGGTVARAALVGGMGLRLEALAQIPMHHQEFLILPYGVIHRIPTLTGRLALGLDVRF